MTQVDEAGCYAIIARRKSDELEFLQKQARMNEEQIQEARKEPPQPTPGMQFMKLLDSMANDIFALVVENKKTVLFDYKYVQGDSYTRDHEVKIVHQLFTTLGIVGEWRAGVRPYKWDEERFLDFKAWMRCRYPGLVSVRESRPYLEDGESCDADFHKVELLRS